jgi:SAM-dependent methyltransferase
MPVKDIAIERESFFRDPQLDADLPTANEVFWTSLIGHIEQGANSSPHVILDFGCHTGGLLERLGRRFSPAELLGVEPLHSARVAATRRLGRVGSRVTLLDIVECDRIPSGAVDIFTSHETLYLEPDLPRFMRLVRRALTPSGEAYIVLGCHSENPLWQIWKTELIAAGHCVYDHAPLDIMEAASRVGLLPSVQPLRTSGWITYEPLLASFRYPNVRMMFDHHYRQKLMFRLSLPDERTTT